MFHKQLVSIFMYLARYRLICDRIENEVTLLEITALIAWLKSHPKYTKWEELSALASDLGREFIQSWHNAGSTAQLETGKASQGLTELGDSRYLPDGNRCM